MFYQDKLNSELTFIQKVKKLDFVLLFSIIILSAISLVVMYSTDGGELLYHSKSHIIRFLTFFTMMILISFINIRTFHSLGYLFYIIVLGLLFWASFFV